MCTLFLLNLRLLSTRQRRTYKYIFVCGLLVLVFGER
jgi:hypothetical protein